MHFAILGPVEVRGDRGPCEPAFPMSRQVLSLLLVHANQVVSLDSLMEELWEERPPRLAKKTVQTHIYHLRKALRDGGEEEARVETEPRGYRIRIGVGQLDLWRFQELCKAGRAASSGGRAAEASEAYREALVLWRGAPFSGTATGALLSAQRARLEDLRMGALERRVEADMELGRHRELLSELKGLTFDHPLSEVLTGQLMRASARSGHRQAALDAYRRLRTAMVDQLGLEPSAEVRELHRGVLEGGLVPERHPVRQAEEGAQPPGRAVPRVPAELPPVLADFTGRRTELARIAEVADSAGAEPDGASAVRVAVVTGGVGTGKTVTAVHAAHRMRSRYPGGQLFATLHRPDGTPVPARDALTSLLLSSGHSGQWLPEAVDDLARLYRSWTSERRMLVVLDDAHCTQQVQPLLPSSPGCAVLITSRWRLEGLPGAVTRVPLTGLGAEEGAALLGSVAGERRIARERHEAEELIRLYGGLPLALRAVGERLSARPDLSVRRLVSRARHEAERLPLLRGPQNDPLARLWQAHFRLREEERELLEQLCRLPQPVLEEELLRAMDRSGPRANELNRLMESLTASHFVELHAYRGGMAFTVPELSRLTVSGRVPQPPLASPRRAVPVRAA